MNLGALLKAFNTAVLIGEAVKRFGTPSTPPPPRTSLEPTVPDASLVGALETRLTNVVVAALKEAFARDHARLELERAQLDEQRRRAEETLRLELRRQAVDRELGRFRMLAAAAFAGWIASVALLVVRLDSLSVLARAAGAAGWLLLLGSLAAAFAAQGRVSAYLTRRSGADCARARRGVGALAARRGTCGVGGERHAVTARGK